MKPKIKVCVYQVPDKNYALSLALSTYVDLLRIPPCVSRVRLQVTLNQLCDFISRMTGETSEKTQVYYETEARRLGYWDE